jgi:methylenetetrahydrofolate dehydrogenase (NADP+)/methenyltetrahydrofolate cyclohydrolase
MHIIEGKKIAEIIEKKIQYELKSQKDAPCLATVFIGDDAPSKIYREVKEKVCKRLGIKSVGIELLRQAKERDVIEEIRSLNIDEMVHGILLQFPLPTHFNTQRIIETITPGKDVEGLHPQNLGASLLQHESFVPCTPLAILKILEHEQIPVEGAEVVIVNHSPILGKPLAILLLNRNATVTICHIYTKNLKEHTSRADILVTGTGVPGLIKKDFVKQGATVIDAGIHRASTGVIQGDVDAMSVQTQAGALTPVPGGVGPVTVAVLMENTVRAYRKATGHESKRDG